MLDVILVVLVVFTFACGVLVERLRAEREKTSNGERTLALAKFLLQHRAVHPSTAMDEAEEMLRLSESLKRDRSPPAPPGEAS